MKLSGAHVLVTGASRGIGACIADGAAALGADLTLVARPSDALTLRAKALDARELPCDLADPGQRADLLARAEQDAGRPVDVLVNCAGVDGVDGMLDVTAEAMRRLYEVNLLAPAELVRQALPGMVARRRGHLVTVSSGFSTVIGAGMTPYASSKAGLSHFHAGVRLELQGTGVRTTLVEPGPVRTEMYDDIEADGLASAVMDRFLKLRLTRLMTPQEVAQQVLDGVEADREHVVPPRRMTPVLLFDWIPRRVAQLVLTGTPRR